ncbi:MAG: fumarylacetoacetate hydrolase family protein [Verrucomicrobia bacterium]|nr:fumarylacetoacetate hydrolase family protein [Verrucomicrobiota bacterium]
MKLCRFVCPVPTHSTARVCNGLVGEDSSVLDLTAAGWPDLGQLPDHEQLPVELKRLAGQADLPRHALDQVRLLPPVERQEVWAAGVTYLRSKQARMEESNFSATAYDRVYEAERPELFFKSLPEKVVGPGQAVCIRRDAKWNVPEPELALVINSRGRIAGYTAGNDMSARDIEGENLLYLPQAKIYTGSCALGPWITVGTSEAEARSWKIQLQISRAGQMVFGGETSVSQIKRSFEELVAFLFRSQTFPHGAVLLTGTGVVPPETFTLQPGDLVRITVSGIGTLENRVEQV